LEISKEGCTIQSGCEFEVIYLYNGLKITSKKITAAKMMNPARTHRAVLSVGSSPGVEVTILG
jgi:hypothetical protein